jgi:Family of unknown function (DUF6058)
VPNGSVRADTFDGYGRRMESDELRRAVQTRFLAVNGDHPMTPEDDAYVTEWFTPLEALAEHAGRDVDDLRRLMLANRLPLPGYIRSDGAQMVPRDLLELTVRSGGVERLPAWFAAHFPDPGTAVAEWDAYLAGHYVCLRSVAPENMKRKDELVAGIERALANPEPGSEAWLAALHEQVDELDALEPPFAPYDRRRFGGLVSRDRLVDAPRADYPRG